MEQYSEVFVGIDIAKTRNAVAVADGERGGEVRFAGKLYADGYAGVNASLRRAR